MYLLLASNNYRASHDVESTDGVAKA
jgi:hypothetical protein